MFKLVIQDDEGKTTVVPLIRDEITIGRKEGNTIRLTERNVSRRHARILRNNGEVQIEDLGSYNGIRVNNARIAERVSLRISDQVQIGDYKLYLKAEGVEQVDDARTMPIERIDSALPTEVMPAVQRADAPTAPMPAPRPRRRRSRRRQRRTARRSRSPIPIRRAARSRPPRRSPRSPQPVGYGKLVVLSSNFAGKEFDLTRPQMIIGRTDENDIVVNHRSISRNHAKVTRDPETGRYTISDLQSSQRRAGQRPGLRQGRAAPRRHRRSRPRAPALRRARRGLRVRARRGDRRRPRRGRRQEGPARRARAGRARGRRGGVLPDRPRRQQDQRRPHRQRLGQPRGRERPGQPDREPGLERGDGPDVAGCDARREHEPAASDGRGRPHQGRVPPEHQ